MKIELERMGTVVQATMADGRQVLHRRRKSSGFHGVAYRSREGQWYALKAGGGDQHLWNWLNKFFYELKMARGDVRWIAQDALDWYVNSV